MNLELDVQCLHPHFVKANSGSRTFLPWITVDRSFSEDQDFIGEELFNIKAVMFVFGGTVFFIGKVIVGTNGVMKSLMDLIYVLKTMISITGAIAKSILDLISVVRALISGIGAVIITEVWEISFGGGGGGKDTSGREGLCQKHSHAHGESFHIK